MNVQKLIAAAAVFVAAGSAFAADAPAAAVAASASSVVIASNLNLPTVTINNSTGQSRAAVRAEAIEFVKNYKTAFAVQLEQYKN
jgi:hypothetical protein